VWALGAVALAATAILSLAAPMIAQRKVNEALRSTSLARAIALTQQAHSWNPVSVDPLLVEASLQPRDNKLRALQLYHMAVDTQPENADTWIQLGTFELNEMKNACAAYRDLNQAYTLDRFNPGIAQKGGPLDVARAKVNKGACRTG
jgi:tetratricopeptide (TPR) repeat protein